MDKDDESSIINLSQFLLTSDADESLIKKVIDMSLPIIGLES